MSEEFNLEKLEKEIFELECFKELNAYNQSEENLANCQPFEQLNQKYTLLQKQYANSFHELYKDIESIACKREYAKGGEGFHRGFYSPSMMDLFVGGAKRSRLLKKHPKDHNYNYEYLFDAQNNLICVYNYSNFDGVYKLVSTELFIRHQDKVLSLVFNAFDDTHDLSMISECRYENGKLLRYEVAQCNIYYGGKGCSEIQVEVLDYVDDLMKSVHFYHFTPSNSLLSHEKYIFSRDEDGYLSTYIVEDLSGFKPKFKTKIDFSNEQIIYKVLVKRK